MVQKVIFVIFVLISFISLETYLKYEIEQQARNQARINLKQIQYCVNENLKDTKNINDKKIGETIDKCGRYSLMSKTGDIFAFKRKDLKFVFDSSSDCFIPGGKYFDKKLENLFYDPQSAKVLKQEMLRGFNSVYGDNKSWRFREDSDEWIEWIYLPSEAYGYDGVKSNGSNIPNQVIVGQGIIEKEYMSKYRIYFVLYNILFFIVLMFLSVRVLLFDKIEKNKLLKNVCIGCDIKKRLEEVTGKQERCHGCADRPDDARCDVCPERKG